MEGILRIWKDLERMWKGCGRDYVSFTSRILLSLRLLHNEEYVIFSVGISSRGEGFIFRIEVVTEGVMLRRLQRDPALEGIGAVIFDEFHERSLDADLALALCRDAQEIGLR